MDLSPYELVFGQKPMKPVMFNLSSTSDSFGNCKPTESSPCIFLSDHTHTDLLGHYPQMKKEQKGTFAHWFLNREKIHSEVYNGVHNYLNQNKHLSTFINRHFGTAHKIIDTPTLVTYKLEDFSSKQVTRHRSNILPYYPKEIFVQEHMEKNFSDNLLLKS